MKTRLDFAAVLVAPEHVRVDGLRGAGERTFHPPNSRIGLQQVTLMLSGVGAKPRSAQTGREPSRRGAHPRLRSTLLASASRSP